MMFEPFILSRVFMNSSTQIDNHETLIFDTFLKGCAEGDDIAAAVAQEALDYDDPQLFFEDLAQHGCVSGAV